MIFEYDNVMNMFLECFFEAQASITDDLKRSINERQWVVLICDEKVAPESSHNNYLMEKFIDAECKLDLIVDKNILSEDEKKLIIKCSTNVRRVCSSHPLKIDRWSPKHKIEGLWMNIGETFVSKKEFEDFVLPWIRLSEDFVLILHDDTNFFEDIYEWLCGSNFKNLCIEYRENFFLKIEELKKLYSETQKSL